MIGIKIKFQFKIKKKIGKILQNYYRIATTVARRCLLQNTHIIYQSIYFFYKVIILKIYCKARNLIFVFFTLKFKTCNEF